MIPQQINIFILVLSLLFLGVRLFDLIMRLVVNNPEPIKYTNVEKIFTYLTISYIITNLII
jgi:hypothetical protein